MSYPRLVDDPDASAGAMHCAASPPDGPPRLLVVVDTEETFDWTAPFDRNATDTGAMSEIGRGQELCEAFGIAPTYGVGYPIASDEKAMERLSRYAAAGCATIGAHLHSWVCPPFDEEVNAVNSYQGNLPFALEKRKLEALSAKIAEVTGEVPRVHKAGRYGFGWGTARALKEIGVLVDLSPSPGFNWTEDGGPNHEGVLKMPQWLDSERELLCIPTTGSFIGPLRGIGPWLQKLAGSPLGERMRAVGVLSRSRALERIRLSPEGYKLSEMKRLTRFLLDQGERVFTLSYHSPSLALGCTPYVRDEHELRAFLKTMEDYFSFFIE